ncbi:formimidoylglutamase [Flammeovirga agarivorans]|uniref:Formimidoylglutamase n=1 Tax=Flammeovirga agarivorans TaxID=2726742 RepID=A0A7X8XV99_9BACT|nr:formimidoylglutamase [Flammeovirga agarivorans]NLR90875.1 formimidoylglutamase [Flammeovirga agarivorans]
MTAKTYLATNPSIWTGRVDGDTYDVYRWHQKVDIIDLNVSEIPDLSFGHQGIAIVGFMCQEGVKRNKGRLGAVDGPYELRKACANLPVHFPQEMKLIDVGNIQCINEDMEGAQKDLGDMVAQLLIKGYRPLVWGGGHEIAYGHYLGVKKFIEEKHPGKTLGILNLDAHFDLREPDPLPSSGTPFYQMGMDFKKKGEEFNYLVIGIQKNSNTQRLYNTANELGVKYISGRRITEADKVGTTHKLTAFVDKVDFIYQTTCMDVFAAHFAPGVSASAYNGIEPNPTFMKLFKKIYKSGKVISSDIAELNPSLDIDKRTAKLAAALSFEIVKA